MVSNAIALWVTLEVKECVVSPSAGALPTAVQDGSASMKEDGLLPLLHASGTSHVALEFHIRSTAGNAASMSDVSSKKEAGGVYGQSSSRGGAPSAPADENFGGPLSGVMLPRLLSLKMHLLSSSLLIRL